MKKKWNELLLDFEWRKNILPYSLYGIGCLFLYHLLISLVVFFHFLLDHNFSTIDQWTLSNGWEILIITKLISLMIFIIFINSYVSPYRSVSKFFSSILGRPTFNRNLWVSIFYLLLAMILIGKPSLNMDALRTFETYSFLVSTLGVMSFFLIDFIVLGLLFNFFPSEETAFSFIRVLVFTIIFSLQCLFLSPYGNGFGSLFIMHSAILSLIFYSDHYKVRWNLIFYLLLIVLPMNNLWGLNFVSGSFNAPFPFQHFSSGSLVLLWSIAYLYLYIRLVNPEAFEQKYLRIRNLFAFVRK